MSKKLLFLDVETTSLNAYNGAIVQIYCIVRIDGKIRESFEIRMKPHEGARIDVNEHFNRGKRTKTAEKGLEYFLEKLEKYVNPYNKKDKFYIVGYNAAFDCDHIRGWFRRCENKWFGSYFWHPPIDVMQLALDFFYKNGKRHELENFKLGTVAKWFGFKVEEENLHDAKYDTILTKDIYRKIRGGTKRRTLRKNNNVPTKKKPLSRVRKRRRQKSS